MDTPKFVQKRVKSYYWDADLNCARTTLKILSEKFEIDLSDQVIDSAAGLNGAGRYGAQCGLVEGMIMFLGILGKRIDIPEKGIEKCCRIFAVEFEKRFSSLLCIKLRPEGFNSKNPPHLCEKLTCNAVCYNIRFIERMLTICFD